MNLEISMTLEKSDVKMITRGLVDHGKEVVSPRIKQELGVFYRDNGRLLAGLTGATYWGWLHIKLLWVDKSQRGKGIGKQLMLAAEKEAIQRGCHAAMLDTLSFQAQDFYHKLGYTVFGQLEDFPIGHQRIYLQKQLVE